MRTLLFVLAAGWMGSALANEPAPSKEVTAKWECLVRGGDNKAYAVVEATDQAKADADCKEAWGQLDEAKRKPRRKNRKGNEGVSDELFSRRTLLR